MERAFYGSKPLVDLDYLKCARYCNDKEGCTGFEVSEKMGGDCVLLKEVGISGNVEADDDYDCFIRSNSLRLLLTNAIAFGALY